MPQEFPSETSRWLRVAGVCMMVGAGFGMWSFRGTPPLPDRFAHEQAVKERAAAFVAREALRWQTMHGDHIRDWTQAKGHLAIVISELGYELRSLQKLLAWRYRLTFAVDKTAPYGFGVILRLLDDPRRPRELWLQACPALGCRADEAHTMAGVTLEKTLYRLVQDLPLAKGVLLRHAVDPHLAQFETAAQMATMLDRFDLVLIDASPGGDATGAKCLQRAGAWAQRADVVIPRDATMEQIRTSIDQAFLSSLAAPTLVVAAASEALAEALVERQDMLEAAEIGVFSGREWLLHQRTLEPRLLCDPAQADPCAGHLSAPKPWAASCVPPGVP